MNLAERIKLVLNETGLNKSQFASKIKVTPATVAYWCSGRTKHLRGDYASRISRVFGYATFWLSEGQGPKMINQNESGFPLVSALDTERIPLIKIEDVEDKTKWKNDSFILTDLDMSSGSFAVEIKDSSMSPAFNIGDRVIFDPSTARKQKKPVTTLSGCWKTKPTKKTRHSSFIRTKNKKVFSPEATK